MSDITRRSALRLFGSAAVVAGLGLVGCQKDDGQSAQTGTDSKADDAPTLADVTVSDVTFDADEENDLLTVTVTLSSAASVPCLAKADAAAIYTDTDENGDDREERLELSWDLVRGANVYTTDCEALIEADGAAELKLYRSMPTVHDDKTNKDTKIDIKNIDVQVSEVSNALDAVDGKKGLLPSEYKLDDYAVAATEKGYGFQVTGTLQNKSESTWKAVDVYFLALEANGNPYRFAYGDDGSTRFTYAVGESEAKDVKSGDSGDLIGDDQDGKYDPSDHENSVVEDQAKLFNIDTIDSVEVLGVVATFDDAKDDAAGSTKDEETDDKKDDADSKRDDTADDKKDDAADDKDDSKKDGKK
ncbi:hypothetical protein [uncultured Enorma sp.]|uniref:hypothetical protein n=1 Tax=uncultured Enorma sp. TaxID=1714346 RepID=UPI002599ABD6|nr:hypothetical protein [uncultured Enorma sp.]